MSIETEVLKLRLRGYTYSEIADELKTSVDIVREIVNTEIGIKMAYGDINVKFGGDDHFKEILARMVTALEKLSAVAEILVEKLESDVSGDSETEEKS